MRALAAVAAVALAAACTSGADPAARPAASPRASGSPAATSVPPAPPAGGPSCVVVRGTRAVSGRPMAFDDARTGVMAYGALVYRTTDGARTWRIAADLPGDSNDLVPAGCGTFYLSMTDGRLYRSVDAGATWSVAGRADVAALDFVTPRTGFGVALSEGSPLYRTADGGRTWLRVGSFGTGVHAVTAATPKLLLAATGRGLLRSADGGATVANVLPRPVASVTFAPGGRHAWALGYDADRHYQTTYRVWHSGDGGLRWRLVTSGRNPYASGTEPDPALGVQGQVAAYGAAALLPGYGLTRVGVTLATDTSLHPVPLPPRYDQYGPHALETTQWVDARHAYAYDTIIGGHLFATSDGGRSWREAPTP